MSTNSIRPWTPAEDTALRAMREEGYTVPQIAEALNRRQKSIQGRCCDLDIPSNIAAQTYNYTVSSHIQRGNVLADDARKGSARLRDAILAMLARRERALHP